MNMEMKIGDIVKVYQRPYTSEKFEGEAKLISFIGYNDKSEDWMVHFKIEAKGDNHRRTILGRSNVGKMAERADETMGIQT